MSSRARGVVDDRRGGGVRPPDLRRDSLWILGLAVPLAVAAVTVAEKTTKLVAEGVFLVGFLRARECARNVPTRRPGIG